MYNVQMKRYTATAARQHLSALLDDAEAGRSVVIEREGVRFSVRAERSARRAHPPAPVVEIVDRDVAEGRWTWAWTRRGLRFSPRRGR